MNMRNYNTLPQMALALAGKTSIASKRIFPALILLLSLPVEASLPKTMGDLLARYKIPQSSVSVTVTPLNTKKPLLLHNAGLPRNPASVMKLVTTFSALEILGPAHTWSTQYFTNGVVHNGVLKGDLVIKGSGDPYLVREQFWLHLVALRELGLKTIKGNLLIDNSAFDLAPYNAGAFDKSPYRLYNVGPAATLLNFNASRFRFKPGPEGIQVLLDPPIHNVVINNQLKAAKGKCRGAENGWSMNVVNKEEKAYVAFTGNYRTLCGAFDLSRSVLASNAYLYGMFVYLWRSLGGEFSGGFANAEVAKDAMPVYVGGSRTLADVINGTNKYSNNLLARQLLLSVGHHFYGEGASVEDGIGAIKQWLVDKGLSFPELVMENGAGLSRQARISAESLNKLLIYASKSIYHPEFMASFSLGGLDGSMRKRLKKLKLGGRARLKTGYIKSVRSLAGYIRADSGKDYAVVLLIQDPKVDYSKGNQIQDAFIKWVLHNG